MARLIDTSLRLLAQEPLAGRMPPGRVLEVAEILDRAGFHALEVTGGGVFRAAVARGVESPWERIRAYRQRVTRTPLAMALRGNFLVGSRPVGDDLVRRFILCAADSGIDIFRLHDPLNDADDLQVAADAVRAAGARLYAGLVYAQAPGGDEFLVERARRLGAMGADRVMLHDPAGQLDPARAGDLVGRLGEAAGVPVGLYAQGPGGAALAEAVEAARAGADPIATATFPVAVSAHRAPGELLAQALAGMDLDAGVDQAVLWEAAEAVDRILGTEGSIPPPSSHASLLGSLNRVNVSLIVGVERRLEALDAADRLGDVLDELHRVRAEVGSPPTASPVGTILVRQSVEHTLSGRRWQTMGEEMRQLVLGEWGQTPGPIDAQVAAVARALDAPEVEIPDLDDARAEAGRLATSEEELCLVALFGDQVRPLLEHVRGRDRVSAAAPGAEPGEADRIRELIALLEASEVGELTIENGGTRITVRKQDERVPVAVPVPVAGAATAPGPAPLAPVEERVTIDSPMVGMFFRSASPGDPPFVSEGDRVEIGQTLCLLEAMKLFNELKADRAGVVRRILVENGAPVEFGQPLFELEP
ncbi:MAG: Biotin carboxyl carrier protein of acetyl-CoA carboxylase [uncultured Thermoleophilia bacterium]|uniref:Biotin carboxyl carrier protein of acetyl-CoA carboxylase n=1 Tax=uncultured Thermoleophilia bacterium TaxID=1497501 RepID=A0A6J4U595_9ACTN|nr:MAG: Biotin carboxyl carrier protein of acetyl-CoA carboxylase [uncultured Thermoleophilia bacterium]